MKPSLKTRNAALLSSNSKIFKISFGSVGIVCCLLSLLLWILLRGSVTHYTTIVNGVRETREGQPVTFLFFLPILLLGIVFILVGFVFVPWIFRIIRKGEAAYPIASSRYSVEELLQDVSTIDDKYEVRVNDNWLDVSYNWMQYEKFIGLGTISSGQNVFMKMFRINSNGTYNELDCEMTYGAYLSLIKGGMNLSFHIGRIREKELRILFGHDSEKGLGAHTYTLDTMELTNDMHKWLADRGYRQVI